MAVRDSHPRKTWSLMEVTLSGMAMEVREAQFSKA